MQIIYLGFNSFKTHKRGVENVIDFQSKSLPFKKIFYVHWGEKTHVYKHEHLICISIAHNLWWFLTLNVIIKRLKRNNSNTIIHSHNALFTIGSILKTDLLTVHDGLYYQNKANGKKYANLFKPLERLLYLRVRMVHFISNYTKSQTLFGDRDNYLIIPNSSHLEGNVDLRETVERKPNSFILAVRSIEERARFDLLLDVAEVLGLNFKFKVAGKGPLLDKYLSEIEKRNIHNVELLGYVSDADIIALYKQCSMVINIAEYAEGFGLPIIEGYLFDKPVIASNRCAIPEVIFSKDDLFENQTDSITGKIREVFETYDSIHSGKFRQHYMLKFANAKIAKAMGEIYQSLKKTS